MAGETPKRQHWVPRFYLREFATPETATADAPQVWVASKKPKGPKDELPFTINVENVAAERFLYSPAREDGTRDFSVEKLLGGLEGLLSQRWRQVANGFVDLEREEPLRKILALFIATMIARHPDHVQRMREMHQATVQYYNTLPKDSQGRPRISHVVREGKRYEMDVSDWDQFRRADENAIRQMFVENIQPTGAELVPDLLAKKWNIVVANEPVFATCDRPVRMRHGTQAKFGTRTPGTVIEFPISPTRFLMLNDFARGPRFGYHPLRGGPGPINLSTWLSTDRFFIASTDPTLMIQQLVEFARAEDRRARRVPQAVPEVRRDPEVRRNSLCPCGSGRKWKRCCGR